jgi:integrase/recombinase XerD
LPQPVDPATLKGCVHRFHLHLEARAYSHSGIESHHWALKQFLAWAESRGLSRPERFTRPLLEEYQLFLFHYRSPRTQQPLATNSQLARLGCIQRFFAWLCRSGVLVANPAADLDLPRKQARALPKSLSEPEITRLLELPDLSSPFGLRDRVVLELFYATGIRRAEMVNLDTGDFDPALQTLHIRRGKGGKGGKDRILPVGARAAQWLERYLGETRPLLAHLPAETALFLSGYGTRLTKAFLGTWVSGMMKRAQVSKPGSCHLFRHSCATHMLEGGADIRYIQAMLGHARLDTTQIYTHVSIRALQDVHARTHPHGRIIPSADPPEPASRIHPEPLASSHPPQSALPVQTPMSATLVHPSPTAAHARGRLSDPKPPGQDEPPSANPTQAPTRPPTRPDIGNSLIGIDLDGDLEPAPSGQLTYYGYRFYDPVTGRWPSRDSIAENGGINLYAFVFNNAVEFADLFGNIPTTYTPPDPAATPVAWASFIDKNGNPTAENPGYTLKNVKITCACACSDKVWQLSCNVVTNFVISLNSQAPLKVTGNGVGGKYSGKNSTVVPWEEIAGHEQRHVQSRIAQVKKVVESKNESLNKGQYSSAVACNADMTLEKISLENTIRRAWEGLGGLNHAGAPGGGNNDPNFEAEFSPIEKVGYPQLPGSHPLPTRP